jgi:membrane fusion protein
MNGNSPTSTFDIDPPYLGADPPPWAARGLANLLLLLFVIAAIAAIVVHVPETVTATFVLAPVRGTDPVRAFRDGIVTDVRTGDAQTLRAGEVMLVISSPPIGDRAAEWQSLKAQLEGTDARVANTRTRFESERMARTEEEAAQRARLASLDRTIEKNTEELTIASQLAERQKKIYEEGISSWMDLARLRLEINRLEVEAEQAKADRENTRRTIERLQHESRAKQSEHDETERSLSEDTAKARIRMAMLQGELAQTGNQLTVSAPCAGTVLRLHVQSVGAAVREGDLLAEVACEGEKLQAELTLPQDGVALVRPGQGVKLLYDAFPYQRYGVRQATVTWVSPATVTEKEGSVFRALADLRDESVLVRGQQRPVAAGMGGRARIVIGRRSLVSYAFEPLRQLKESLSGAPSK